MDLVIFDTKISFFNIKTFEIKDIIQFDIKTGEIPERSKGTDCKSVDFVFTGSNPVLPTIYIKLYIKD